ncbi:hypothetical protein PO909_027577, partial [Leuciscus waleckii]
LCQVRRSRCANNALVFYQSKLGLGQEARALHRVMLPWGCCGALTDTLLRSTRTVSRGMLGNLFAWILMVCPKLAQMKYETSCPDVLLHGKYHYKKVLTSCTMARSVFR